MGMKNREHVVSLTGLKECEPSSLGAKAVGLAKLMEAGLPVPKAFCVCAEAYAAHLDALGLPGGIESWIENVRTAPDDVAEQLLSELRATIARSPLDATLLAEIEQAYATLDAAPVAVRSSATAEDLPGHSFAGQYDTFLGIVSAPACVEAVKRCWASLWTRRAFEYREKHGIGHGDARMAVIVQTMVNAEASGVLFTADPATGRRDRIVIEACFGLGEALVSGKVTPDRFVIAKKNGDVTEHVVGDKQIEACMTAEGGIIEQAIAGARCTRECLDADTAVALARCGGNVEALFGVPQDIEWALHDRKWFLLQSRPITALPAEQSWEDRQVWTNANTGEVLPDVITPLTWSFIQVLIHAMFKAVMGWIGVDFGAFKTVGLIGGRVYFNVNVMVGLIRFLPGMRHQDIGKIFGGAQKGKASFSALALPEEDIPKIPFNPLKVLLKTPLFVLRMLARSGGKASELLERMRNDSAAIRARNLETMPEEALRTHLAADLDSMRTFIEGLALSGTGMFWFIHLDKLCRRWFGEEGATFANQLLAGSGGLDSAESGLDLWRLAAEAHAHSEVEPLLLRQDSWESIRDQLQASSAGRNFLNSWEAFMAAHGHHTRGELELFNPRWRETPGYILDIVRGYLRAMEDFDALVTYQRRASDSETLAEHCRTRLRNPLKRAWFNLALRHAKHGCLIRENIKSGAIRYWASFRDTMRAIGRRLEERGALGACDDIFFLTLEDVARLTDRKEPDDFQETIAARRAEYEQFQTVNPPGVVIGHWDASQAVPEIPPDSTDVFNGIAVSPGVVTGPARIIVRAEARERVLPGEILVAPFTDPGWTPYFMTAAAIVMDQGGILSHGSIVAREYGIPAVVNVGPATKTLYTGELLEVDGNRGTVRRLSVAGNQECMEKCP